MQRGEAAEELAVVVLLAVERGEPHDEVARALALTCEVRLELHLHAAAHVLPLPLGALALLGGEIGQRIGLRPARIALGAVGGALVLAGGIARRRRFFLFGFRARHGHGPVAHGVKLLGLEALLRGSALGRSGVRIARHRRLHVAAALLLFGAVPQAVQVVPEHRRQRHEVDVASLVREEPVEPLGRHGAVDLRADELQRLARATVEVRRERLAHQIEQHRLDGDVARHVPHLTQHRVQHERMAEDAVEQAVQHVAHHFVRRDLEAIDDVHGIVHEPHAVARDAVHVEARLERHAPQRLVEETEVHGEGGTRLFEDVMRHRHARLVERALALHALLGHEVQALGTLLRLRREPEALLLLEDEVALVHRCEILHSSHGSPHKLKSMPVPPRWRRFTSSKHAVACACPAENAHSSSPSTHFSSSTPSRHSASSASRSPYRAK